MTEILVEGRRIGEGHSTFIIAELSANHLQQFDLAVATVKAAKESGADAIKLQTYTPDTLTLNCDAPLFRTDKAPLWAGQTLYQLYEQAYTPWEWQPKLKAIAEELGLICFSTPFDLTAVAFLEEMDVPCYKIASCELVDIGLIEAAARHGKPMILSTGIATLEEIEEAVAACRRVGNRQIALLKCATCDYPTPMAETHLRQIPDLMRRFNVPVGISDHSLGSTTAIAAVALGGTIIEKHFILHRGLGGPDAAFSMEPHEFAALVQAVRDTEQALGSCSYAHSEAVTRHRHYRRSLFVTQDIAAGETLTSANVRSIRPGSGLPPKHLPELLGRRANTAISRGTPLTWDLVATDA